MKISSKGRHALRLLIDLAQHQNDGFVSLREISDRQNVSKQYLEQVILVLAPTKFLRASRGKQGGYKLANEPSKYTVGQILRITEGSLAFAPCLEFDVNECNSISMCRTLPIWKGLGKVVSDYLDNITLQNILDMETNTCKDCEDGKCESHVKAECGCSF